MAQPTEYDRQNSFTLLAQQDPSDPYTGADLDEEFNAVKVTLDETLANLALIQRDDGRLANQSVGPEQLAASLSIGINPPSAWTTATAYALYDTVFETTSLYKCLEAHTSGAFATDLAAEKWELLADFNVVAVEDGSVTEAKLATGAVTASKIGTGAVTVNKIGASAVTSEKINDGAVTAPKIGTNAVTSDKIQDDAVTEEKIADEAVAYDKLLAEIRTPVGAVIDYAGASAPSGWLFCYGQAVSRSTYSALFTALSTTYGAGDGSTTFNVPDARGRVVAGQDDMGGSSANRLTNVSGGVEGDTLGAAGGSETHVLTEAQLASHTHVFTGDAMAAHGHVVRIGLGGGSGGTDSDGGFALENASDLNYSAFTGTPTATLGQQLGGASAGTPAGTNANTGSGTAHNNVQPTLILNKIIFAGV